MIFLIHYDRRAGTIREIIEFADSERSAAESARLNWEINKTAMHNFEIVLLEANSLEQLKQTHRRYFASVEELLKTAADEATTSSTKANEG